MLTCTSRVPTSRVYCAKPCSPPATSCSWGRPARGRAQRFTSSRWTSEAPANGRCSSWCLPGVFARFDAVDQLGIGPAEGSRDTTGEAIVGVLASLDPGYLRLAAVCREPDLFLALVEFDAAIADHFAEGDLRVGALGHRREPSELRVPITIRLWMGAWAGLCSAGALAWPEPGSTGRRADASSVDRGAGGPDRAVVREAAGWPARRSRAEQRRGGR